jgi:hypothetical protein
MHRLDFSVVRDLTDADLKDLGGVVLGSAKRWAYSDMPSFSSQSAISCDRRKILRAIARLDGTPETAVLMPEPPSTLAVHGSPAANEQRDVTLYGIAQATEGENPRANYHRLIACAVKGLDRSTSEARQAVYERARTALIAHLRLKPSRTF